ncbi:hypothetical protein O6P43_034656 [Quillaja saponaria]|uniref:Uncharacterized protein n=1 Tax=Quillaja saponaria TaxID=32244 RepID=A0AAD7KMM2_QUISA|nr:hypothetical protein O6P43_034656 [Quillaja saponaria]
MCQGRGAVAAGDHRRPPPTTAGGGGFRRVGKFWLENFGVAVPRIDSYANAGRVEPCGLSTRLARRGRRRRRLTPRGDARVVAAAVPNRFSCQGGVRGALRAVDARLARRGRRRRRCTPRGDTRVVAATVPNRFVCQRGVRVGPCGSLSTRLARRGQRRRRLTPRGATQASSRLLSRMDSCVAAAAVLERRTCRRAPFLRRSLGCSG